MEVAVSCLDGNFGANHSDELLSRWRKACRLVKNRRRRFRVTAHFSKRSKAAAMRQADLQEKLSTAVLVSKAAFQFAMVTFAVLVQRLTQKLRAGTLLTWSGEEALKMLEFFAYAVTIIVVAVSEGLPLAVTLCLAFAMKKMMNGKALVQHLAACKINAGSSRRICSDETGMLTPNWMTVAKSCICMNGKEASKENQDSFCSQIPDSAMKIINKEGKCEILGTPTETASLEFGLSLGGDFQAEQLASKLVGVEPFNSTKKLMGVVLEPPRGGLPTHTKGPSEIVLEACDKAMARLSPMDGLMLVKELPTTPVEVVAVTGDGTNDASVLHEEDIGLATGTAGTEVAKQSAGVITLGDNLATVRTMAKWERSVYIDIKKSLQFQLAINVVALIVNFSCVCLTGNSPLTAVQQLWINMIMVTPGAFAPATELLTGVLMKSAPVGKKGKFINELTWRNILAQTLYQFAVIWWYLQAKGKALFNLYGPDADLILNTLIFSPFVFCQEAKHRADAIILDGTFSSIVTGVKWGCSAYIYNIQKFAEFQLKNVLPLIVYFSSACLTGNAQLTAVLLLILGALAKKTISKRILSFFILMGLVFLLEIQVVEGRVSKAVSDVKASPPLTSFKEMFSAEKKVDPVVLHPPPLAASPPHH